MSEDPVPKIKKPAARKKSAPAEKANASPVAKPDDVSIAPPMAIAPPITGILNPVLPIHFPIIFNTNPAIGSLSPSGAVVGGSDFSLTVLGSNFGNGSTVLWNQAPRTTTVVSSTQLNAAIAAADLAAVGSPTVVVSNQGAAGTAPVLSNGVAFTIIPNITDIVNQLKGVTAIPPALLAELQTYLTIQQSQVDTLTTQVSTDQTNASNLNSQIANLQTQVTQQTATINTLTSQLSAAKSQSASPLDVAQSFKSVVDQIQQAAQSAGGVQTTVTNMNVQLKSLVSVQAATATAPALASLIFPDPTALPDPQHLSTLSFSFGAIPNLKTAPISSTPSATPASSTPTPAPPHEPAPQAAVTTVSQPAAQAATDSPAPLASEVAEAPSVQTTPEKKPRIAPRSGKTKSEKSAPAPKNLP